VLGHHHVLDLDPVDLDTPAQRRTVDHQPESLD
jgi:hypothetical protein